MDDDGEEQRREDLVVVRNRNKNKVSNAGDARGDSH